MALLAKSIALPTSLSSLGPESKRARARVLARASKDGNESFSGLLDRLTKTDISKEDAVDINSLVDRYTKIDPRFREVIMKKPGESFHDLLDRVTKTDTPSDQALDFNGLIDRLTRSDGSIEQDVGSFDDLVGIVDKMTKVDISRDDVIWNQEHNEAEKLGNVVGTLPKKDGEGPGDTYPLRLEVERRPETGDRSFGSLMAFDGAGPETINGRLAMLGIVWAFVVERTTGYTVAQQLYLPGNKGLFFFLMVTQLIWYASLVPMFKGESPDSRVMGPWRAKAERWNGRLAMIGFLSLILTESVTRTPVFHM